MVFSFIKAEEESALVGELMVYFCIDIIEVIVVFFIFRQKRSGHQVQIGAASCQTERSFIFYDRSFKMQLAGQQADTDRSMIILHIAVIGADINDRR